MKIIITKIVKNKWYKITLLLSNINLTFTMSWTSIITSQMAMISNFIRFNIFSQNRQVILFLKSSSSSSVIMISFLVFLK